MMVSGQTHDSFMASLNKLVDVFPSPAFTRAEAGAVRRAAGCGEDANSGEIQSEFARVDPAFCAYKPHCSGGRSGEESPAGGRSRRGFDGRKKLMGDFKQQRESLISGIASGLADLQGKSAVAWVFTASGDLPSTLLELVKGSRFSPLCTPPP